MKFDLHFSSAPAFLWLPRGRRRFCSGPRKTSPQFLHKMSSPRLSWPEVAPLSLSLSLCGNFLSLIIFYSGFISLQPPWKVNLLRKINFINKKIASLSQTGRP